MTADDPMRAPVSAEELARLQDRAGGAALNEKPSS
jgi:hypothetical protein